MNLVLGIDLGTSYFKLGLFDVAGRLQGLARIPVENDLGSGDRCELPVARFWSTLRQGLAAALVQAGAQPSDIRAVSYASQANSFVLLDEHRDPLTPLVLWPDRRATHIDPAVAALWRRGDFLETAGFRIESPEFCIAKLAWFRTQRPHIWARVRYIMTISDYLTFAVTRERVGDAATASLLGLWDVQRKDWWDVALDALGLHRSQWSTPLLPGTVAGVVTTEGAARLGVPAGIPFAVGSLDHHAAAIGAGIDRNAPLSESTGTVLACVRLTDEYRPHPDYCIGPHAANAPRYYQLAFDANGAAALEWYQREFAPDLTLDELLHQAEQVSMGCDGLVARPCPERFPAREGFLNARDIHGHGHHIRAILESVAATLAELMRKLYPENPPTRIVSTGGGARSDLWLQIKADLLGIEIITPQCPEPACLGAAMFAAVAAEWFPDLDALTPATIAARRAFKPNVRFRGPGQSRWPCRSPSGRRSG